MLQAEKLVGSQGKKPPEPRGDWRPKLRKSRGVREPNGFGQEDLLGSGLGWP